jgi:hypothetical protein
VRFTGAHGPLRFAGSKLAHRLHRGALVTPRAPGRGRFWRENVHDHRRALRTARAAHHFRPRVTRRAQVSQKTPVRLRPCSFFQQARQVCVLARRRDTSTAPPPPAQSPAKLLLPPAGIASPPAVPECPRADLRDSHGSVSNAGNTATPPPVPENGPGKTEKLNRSVSAIASAFLLDSTSRNAGLRSSCVTCAAAIALANSRQPRTPRPLRSAAQRDTTPSSAGWRTSASNRSRTTGRIIESLEAKVFAYLKLLFRAKSAKQSLRFQFLSETISLLMLRTTQLPNLPHHRRSRIARHHR